MSLWSPHLRELQGLLQKSSGRYEYTALLTLGGCDVLVPRSHSQPLKLFVVVGLSHDHFKVKDDVTVNEVFPSLKYLPH